MSRSVAALLLGILLAGCGKGEPPSAEVAASPGVGESPAPMEHVPGQVEELAPDSAGTADSLAAARIDREARGASPRAVVVAPPAPAPLTPPARLVPGYRVQLFQSTVLRAAESFRDEAAARLPGPIYVEFQAPLYKVRAGNFATPDEARLFRDRVAGLGYERAEVVATLVAGAAADSLAGRGPPR